MTHDRSARSRSYRSPHSRDATAFGVVLCVILVSLLATAALVVVDTRVGDEAVQSSTTDETGSA